MSRLSRPVLLDLCSCQGGAARGYEQAGFDVIRVDVVEHTGPGFPGAQLLDHLGAGA